VTIKTWAIVGSALALSLPLGALAQDADKAAAESVLRKNKCTTCHAIDKKKDGPSYKEVSAKYKGKADAEKTLTTFLTTGPMVKVEGKEEAHKEIKASDAELKNLVAYILSL